MKELLQGGTVSWIVTYELEAGDRPTEPPPSRGFHIEPITDPRALFDAKDPEIAALAVFGGRGSHGFAARDGGTIAAVMWYRAASSERDASVVSLHTSSAYLHSGVTAALIAHSSAAMLDRGFERLVIDLPLQRIRSLVAFERACWRYSALEVRISRSRPWRRSFTSASLPGQVVASARLVTRFIGLDHLLVDALNRLSRLRG